MKPGAVLMGKLPRAGRVKTRLGLPGETAARLYRALLSHAFHAVDEAMGGEGRRVFACALAAGEEAEAQALMPEGWGLSVQPEAELGVRMLQAWRAGLTEGGAVLLGSDLPELDGGRVRELLEATASSALHEVVFVPAEDGGYGAFGARELPPGLFEAMPWSTSEVMACTRAAAAAIGCRLFELAPVSDLDHPADLRALEARLPPEHGLAEAVRAAAARLV